MKTRQEAVAILDDRDGRLHQLLDRLGAEPMAAPATIGGGDWSAKDLLAHIAFWEELAVERLGDWRAGQLPPRRETDELNAENQERSAGQSLETVRERARSAHAGLVQAIVAMDDEEWTETRAFGERAFSLGELLGGITAGEAGAFDHVDAHIEDLRAYVESLSGVRPSGAP